MQVEVGKVAIIHYTLRDDDGEVLDTSRERGPMPYLHGSRNIVAGLEKALEGKEPGATLEVSVPPEEGYGARSEQPPQAMPRKNMPETLSEGMQLVMETDQGRRRPVWVSSFNDEEVFLSMDHPLAGKNLNFEVELLDVRDSTPLERDHGHAHGLDGHAHHPHMPSPTGRRSLRRKKSGKKNKRK